jgi:hypothetical protein
MIYCSYLNLADNELIATLLGIMIAVPTVWLTSWKLAIERGAKL